MELVELNTSSYIYLTFTESDNTLTKIHWHDTLKERRYFYDKPFCFILGKPISVVLAVQWSHAIAARRDDTSLSRFCPRDELNSGGLIM